MLFVGCKEGYFDEVAKMSIMKGKKEAAGYYRLLSERFGTKTIHLVAAQGVGPRTYRI